jgi:cysteine synthase
MWVLGQHDEPYRKARNSILNLIGNTPLVRLKNVIPKEISPKVEIYAKLEGFNPGGSVKDRPALSMFLDAMEKGLIKEGKVVIDATSGNTGIALAMPVFPEVASMTTLPSFMSPLFMASKNIERAGLSFTEPPGLKPSSLA